MNPPRERGILDTNSKDNPHLPLYLIIFVQTTKKGQRFYNFQVPIIFHFSLEIRKEKMTLIAHELLIYLM